MKVYSPSWRHSARTTANECRSKVIDRRMCDARRPEIAEQCHNYRRSRPDFAWN